MKLSEILKKAEAPQDQIDAAIATEEALEKANSEAATRRKTASELKDKLALFGDLNPEEINSLKDKASKAEQARLKAEGNFEKALEEAMKGLTGENEKLQSLIKGRDATLEKLLIDNSILSAVDGKAVNGEQVMALIRSNIKLDGDSPVVMEGESHKLNPKGEKMSVAEYALDYLDKNPHLAKANGGGSGSGGNNGGKAEGKVIPRADFNSMDGLSQANHIKSGGTVTDK